MRLSSRRTAPRWLSWHSTRRVKRLLKRRRFASVAERSSYSSKRLASTRKISSLTRIFLPSVPAWKSTTTTRLTLSTRRVRLSVCALDVRFLVAFRTWRFRFEGTSLFEEDSTRRFCTTRAKPAWIWVSSTPLRLKKMFTRISTRSFWSTSRTFC